MSEFECKNGHVQEAGTKCKVCGEKIVRMDGMTARQIKQMDEDDKSEDKK